MSGGSINSPQLLELSGIGQPDRLRGLGIEVRHALPGVGENLRDHYAPRTRWTVGSEGRHLQRSRPWPRPREPGAALGVQTGQSSIDGRRAAACLRALARGARRARPAAGLGADVHRSGPARAADRAPVGRLLLRPSDAAREQGPHPHRLGRCAPGAGDPLQLPVGAGRRRTDRARRPHRPRHHDRAGDGAAAGDGDRARPRAATATTRSSTGCDALPRRPITRSAPARWARMRWPSSTRGCASTASRACASPTPRSCRR